MPFYEFRFPDGISKQAVGGPEFNTLVNQSDAGFEQRTQLWEEAEINYTVGFECLDTSEKNSFLKFFYVVAGRYNGFRYKDWVDYRVESGEGVLAMITATTFQLYKRYEYGGYYSDRKINKPVSGLLSVTGGTLSSIDYSTGIVTMTSGTPTSWTGEFDIPARLDSDKMKLGVLTKTRFNWKNIEIAGIKL